eukprot:gene15115-6296_t
MGLKYSKFGFLPYEEAVKRVRSDELDRIKLAFKRFSGNSSLMPKNTFINDILGDVIGKRLAEHLYMSCGGTNKGIGFKDVLCTLVMITSGFVEEKVKFIFGMVSVDGNYVTIEDLENFLNVCECQTLPKCLQHLMVRGEKFTYEDFYDWILQNENFCDVSKWLLSEQRGNRGVKLSSIDDTPSFYQCLEMNTNCFLRAMDENRDGHVDFKELVLGIFACCRGTTCERLTFCFKMFDHDGDGILSQEELNEMVHGLIETCELVPNQGLSTDPNDLLNAIIKDKTSPQMTLNDFFPWASSNKYLHELLLLLSQICHIIFGLRPSTREEEGFIIRRWIEREQRKGLTLGALYYLIASSWWCTWLDYVNQKSRRTSSTTISPRSSSSSTSSTQSTWVDIDTKGYDSADSGSSRMPVKPVGTASKRSTSTTTQVQVEPSGEQHDFSNGKMLHLTSNTFVYPGQIDNAILLQPNDQYKQPPNLTGEGGKLKPHLTQGRDYEVLPEPVWRAISAWYGGNVALPRSVIIVNDSELSLTVELYPIQLHLYRHVTPPKHTPLSFHSLGLSNFSFHSQSQSQAQPPIPVQPKRCLMYYGSFSRKNTLKQVQDYIGMRLKIRPDDLRLWDFTDHNLPVLLEEESRTLEDYKIKDGHRVLIESPLVKGATGLHNLGNTCFMNSAIQCISNTYPLTMYFLGKLHLFELNRTNPLGLKGILAKRYGDLVYDLWNGLYRSIAPVKLRWTIGKYAPQFNGFQQHDAQELLSFLLDGLHEDLNRVHDKPYIELKDSAGRPDKEVAQEAWENHRKRNQSIIVDLFQGQLKSQVRCLACGNSSVRFDPYTFLSLPIPMENSLHLEITVFTLNGTSPVRYGLLLCNEATVKTLKLRLGELSGIPCDQLVIAETFGAVITALLPDSKKLRENVTGILYAYEVKAQASILEIPSKLPVRQRASSPAILETSAEALSATTQLSETSVLGGSPSNGNVLQLKAQRSPKNSLKSPRKSRIMPWRFEKKSNGITPTQSEHKEATVSNGYLRPNLQSSSSDNLLDGNCSFDSSDPLAQKIVIVMHRKMVQMDAYFLSWQKFRPTLFGVPLLISCSKTTKRRDIYEDVWREIKRFVSTQASERRNNSEKGIRFNRALFYRSKRYPFELKFVQRDGQFCSFCPWYKFCRGCKLLCDGEPLGDVAGQLAIDWDPTTLHLNYQQGQERAFIQHPSLEESMRLLREPINIDQCLRDFTKEEELGDDETWYCPECKKHQKIAKKFSLWTLPPILIIHIKRFQLLNNRWIKSNKIVKFPMKKFDPSSYLEERDRRKRNPSERRAGKILNVRASDKTAENPVNGSTSTSDIGKAQNQFTISEDILALEIDEIEDCLNESDDGDTDNDYNYRLFAISCHSGMLNGGHYISYARNPNDKWYKYNDSSCKEIDPSELENESPYLLFFEKENIHISDYLPDIKGSDLEVSLDDDDFDSEVKKYCVIQ